MKAILTGTALATILLVAGAATTPSALAQDNQPCVGENCPPSDMQGRKERMQRPDAMEDQSDQMRKKRMQGSTDDGDMDDGDTDDNRKLRKQRAQQDKDVDVNTGARKSASRNDWRFNSREHRRSKNKSTTFRFYLDGWWYPEPYWEVYTLSPRRVSCREGRAIVDDIFNRVRVVECNGRTYTYVGRRQGDTYRILLNARTGRIVGRTLL